MGRRRGRPVAVACASAPPFVSAAAAAAHLIILLLLSASSVIMGALAATAPVSSTHPAYYDLLRTSPEEMGVIGTRSDTTGQCHAVEFTVRDDDNPNQSWTVNIAEITALLPYTIRHYQSNSGRASEDSIPRPGVINDAAALLLAVTHFNNGITPYILDSLQPDVQKAYEECNVKLTTELFDTGYSPIQSTRTLTDVLDRPHTEQTAPSEPLPTAVLGAFRSASSRSGLRYLRGSSWSPTTSNPHSYNVRPAPSRPRFGRVWCW